PPLPPVWRASVATTITLVTSAQYTGTPAGAVGPCPRAKSQRPPEITTVATSPAPRIRPIPGGVGRTRRRAEPVGGVACRRHGGEEGRPTSPDRRPARASQGEGRDRPDLRGGLRVAVPARAGGLLPYRLPSLAPDSG